MRQMNKFYKTAKILVQNVPQPSKMFPRCAGGACTFFHVCFKGDKGVQLKTTCLVYICIERSELVANGPRIL